MASTSNSDPPSAGEFRNWLELPPDLMSTILHRLGAIEILTNAQNVCVTWRQICKEPAMWRVIDMHMHNLGTPWDNDDDLVKMTRHAVDRGGGQVVDINVGGFATDELLEYISDRSGQLRRLQLVCCHRISSEGLIKALNKLPLLEELNLYFTKISKEAIEVAGRCCPLLKSFKLNNLGSRRPCIECDEEALAIAENMPELRHLQLVGSKMTSDGLQVILDNCPHLESLDLRQCFNVYLGGNLRKICSERITDLRLPCDSTEDYGFDDDIQDSDSFDEDYPSGFSDVDLLSDDDEYYEFSEGSDLSDYEVLFND